PLLPRRRSFRLLCHLSAPPTPRPYTLSLHDALPISIRSEHRRLAGHLHPADNPVAAVVLSGAVGVAQGYYTDFARWLAEERGIACLTYDYRDFGASATGRLRRSDATMTDWGVSDQMAARAFVEATFPGLPV